MTSSPNLPDEGATRDITLSPLESHPANSAPLLPRRLAAFAGVRTDVTVLAGAATASIGELLALKEGAVLRLDRTVDAPFDVVLDGAVLARGQLVAVGEHFGLRITEICLKGQD